MSNLIVVGWVGECERQHALLLQVGLVDAGKRFHNDGTAAEMSGLQGGVLAGRTLAVVLVTDGHPSDALRFVVARNVRHSGPVAGQLVLDFVHFVVFDVNGAAREKRDFCLFDEISCVDATAHECAKYAPNEHVVGDVVQMAAVFQPWAGGRNVIGGALALDLDQNGQIGQILAVPGVEWLEQLQALALRVDVYLDS